MEKKISEREEEILSFWREKKIFEKTLEQTRGGEPFVFYDGPPFATGLPHYGHILASTIKDVIPRYQTMKGRYVRRIWGWDCHGLPIENIIEKELGLARKKDIETLGIEKFNEAARAAVLRYDEDWKKIIPRLGRWVDMDRAYVTMDWRYTESVWWAFKKLCDAGFVYEGYKPMHICPRCETTLAVSEVGMNYRDVKDLAVTAKFELLDEPGTFLLAWTTTAWTLPGNVALAVGEDIEYVKVGIKNQESGVKEEYAAAKSLVAKVFDGKEYEITREFLGKELVGKKYKPLFDYYAADEKLKNRENGWKVVAADFVTAEEGTGIVHIAPAFGEDDMKLGEEKNLPFIQHIGMDGRFKPEMKDFAGMQVKAKGDTQSADVEVLKNAAHRGLLFAKEKIEHPYPLCWRCDTPLLNYAASSWFVKVTALKDKLIAENRKVKWVPEHMRDGRFGHWLEGARDWAISRSRYWGAPIPVWRCGKCKEAEIIGSLDDLKKCQKPRNRYFVMRHGEAESNVQEVCRTTYDDPVHLTEKGKGQAKKAAETLQDRNISRIVSSDFVRGKETAAIVSDMLEIPQERVSHNAGLREINVGEFDNGSLEKYHAFRGAGREKFTRRPEGGESLWDVRKRVMETLRKIDVLHEGENILLVTHDATLWMLFSGAQGKTMEESEAIRNGEGETFLGNGEIKEFSFIPFPHNADWGLDLHRPYIDEMKWPCECGGEFARLPEVFDCWFESGSMPYAQFHYLGHDGSPEGKLFRENFPADFIAEGLDQTRGWFYTMLVLSVGLFEHSPYKNVVVNGLVLAEDGQKMSKKLKNYPDPMDVVAKYGADALRYYLLSSPVVHGEDLNFSEKSVDEMYKKVILRLQNVLSFYELYPTTNYKLQTTNLNVLDQWILARLHELVKEVSGGLDAYELDRASKPVAEFIDDLSTWYLRRSRERMKEGEGREVLRYVLLELSKIIAPFTPFLAEEVYGRAGGEKESVHRERFSIFNLPAGGQFSKDILDGMKQARLVASLGLEARAHAGIKVRQPLSSLTLKTADLRLKTDLLELVKEEVNVKKVTFDAALESEARLDTNITEELREEGVLRELIRNLQEFRKESGMMPSERDKALLVLTDENGEAFMKKFETEIKKSALFKEIRFGGVEETERKEIHSGGFSLAVSVV